MPSVDAAPFDPIRVRAVGQAPEELINAREAAIEDALRRCVEAAGVQVASYSETRDYVLIQDVIYTRTAGLVEQYRVLEENPDQNGLYTVRVEAVVSRGSDINLKIEAWKALLRRVGRPTVMVVGSADRKPFDERLTTTLQGDLERRGLAVRDLGVLTENQRRDAERATEINADAKLAALIADEAAADYLIVVGMETASPKEEELYGVTTHRAQASGFVRIISADTATVLGSETINSSATSESGQKATWDATSRALSEALDAAIKRVATHWLAEVDQRGGREITLTLERFDTNRLAELIRKLRGVEGIREVIVDATDAEGRSHLRAVTWSSAADVGFTLQRLDPSVRITRSTRYRVYATDSEGWMARILTERRWLPWAIVVAALLVVFLLAAVLKRRRKSVNA